MTIYYVDSVSGSATSPYDTWAKAAVTLAQIDAIDAAGDTIYVASTHNESTAASLAFNWAGTAASPTTIICADKTSGAPPTTIATGGTVTTTLGSAINVANNGFGYMYGLTFVSGSGSANSAQITANATGNFWEFDNCSFQEASTNAFDIFTTTNSNFGSCIFNNCSWKFGNAGQKLGFNGKNIIRGGSLLAGGSSPTTFTIGLGGTCELYFESFDLSNAAAAINLSTDSTGDNQVLIFRNTKLPASWSGSVNLSTPGAGLNAYSIQNTDSAATNYRIWDKRAFGETKSETTVVRTSGASDGTTSLSWKMASNANALYPHQPLPSLEIVQWNDVAGSAKTATIEFVHDTNVAAGQGAGASFAFQNNEVWMEVQYLSATGSPLGAIISSAKANILAAAADITSSSAAWTTTGLTTPVKQKMSVTFTPQMKGFIHAKVYIGKASKTIYVDPLLTVA